MVREWNRKNREHRIEEILSSLLFGFSFGFMAVGSLQIILFALDTANSNWISDGLLLSSILSVGMYVSTTTTKPSVDDAKFIVSARKIK